MSPSPSDLLVRTGQVTALRLVDIAYAIDLKKAETLWAARSPRAGERRGLAGTPPKAMSFGIPPLILPLPPVTLMLEGGSVEAQVTARVYDFGIISLSVTVPLADLPWFAFADRVNQVQRAVGLAAARHDGAPWSGLLDAVRTPIAEAIQRPAARPMEEDYLLAIVNWLDETMPAEALLERIDLIPLLTGEDRPLSAGSRAELLRQRFSYYVDDLVVLTWDRAFLYEPRDTDVRDVLEVANAQLLEMRFYDELLDELPRIYDTVEAARRTPFLLSARRYARIARRLHGLVAEVTELTEHADNALQVTEDVYLARVYAAAMTLFRVALVGAAIDRKLQTLRETYQALYDEAHSSRAELLEITVVLLITLEVVLSLVRH